MQKAAQPRRLALPTVAPGPARGTLSGARFALFFTVAAWAAYVIEQTLRVRAIGLNFAVLAETSIYLLIVTALTLSAVAYLVTRIGYLERIRSHRRVPRSVIDDLFDASTPTMTVLIPSYREDERVIRQTLLTAALQEYPNLRVVLLVDDPPHPSEPSHVQSLHAARSLPGLITELLNEPRERFHAAIETFEHETSDEHMADASTLETLAGEYDWAAAWFRSQADATPVHDHTDEFLVVEFLGRMAGDLEATAVAVREAVGDVGGGISRRRVHQLYARLVRIFDAELTSFERKQFASLSHEPNKAMNLNSYLGLMGANYRVASSPGGPVLVPAFGADADLRVPQSDYILTLDADSMLLPEYCLRLVYFMQQPENADVAVVQTPYSAYRGSSSAIERIAGATTDVQHIVHQGLTKHGATFWVGANAVIRRSALDELLVESDESGFVVRRYIEDTTVIEDTESSIHLRSRGWRLHNYPERLSYSATPPDFGALVIQRRRWANGGLVILPQLVRQFVRRGPNRPSLAEFFLRLNYLASISWASLGLLVLLVYPFDGELLSRFAIFTALPYFWAMSIDLHAAGYRRSDILAVYGFNLLLLPVNLVGTSQSLIQAIGGQKIAFARTPKVRNRTVAPLTFVVVPVVLAAWAAWTLSHDLGSRAYTHGAFAAANLVMTVYASLAFIGLRAMAIDVAISIRDFVYRPVPARTPPKEVPHWASVLFVGAGLPDETERSAPLAVALAAHDRLPQAPSLEAELGLAINGWGAAKARALRVEAAAARISATETERGAD